MSDSPQLPTPELDDPILDYALTIVLPDYPMLSDEDKHKAQRRQERAAVKDIIASRLALQAKAADERFERAIGPDDDHTYMERPDRATAPVRTRNQLRKEARQRWYEGGSGK